MTKRVPKGPRTRRFVFSLKESRAVDWGEGVERSDPHEFAMITSATLFPNMEVDDEVFGRNCSAVSSGSKSLPEAFAPVWQSF